MSTDTTIRTTRNYSTKRLARELGIPRAELLETLRNNEVPMDWDPGTSTWRIRHRADADTAVIFYEDDAADRAAEAEREPARAARKTAVRDAYLALEAAVDAADEDEHEGGRGPLGFEQDLG